MLWGLIFFVFVLGLWIGWVVGSREAESLREQVRGLWADLRGEN